MPEPGPLLDPQGSNESAESLVRGLEVATGYHFPTGGLMPTQSTAFERALVTLVEERFKEAQPETWRRRKEGLANVEFFLGRHWAHWDDDRKRYIENSPRPQNSRYSPKTTINIFQSIARTATSRFLSAHPQVTIVASSSDQKQIDAARRAQRVVGEAEWKKQRMDSILATLTPHVIQKGDGFLKVTFDPKAGKSNGIVPVYKLDDAGEPIPKLTPNIETGEWEDNGEFETEVDEGTGEPLTREDFSGQTKCRVVDAHNVVVDSTVTEFEDAGWVIEEQWLSPASIQNRYPGKYTQPSKKDRYEGAEWSRSGEMRDGVQVLEMWIRKGTWEYEPGKSIRLDTGYMAVIADGQVLEHGPNTYRHGEIPYFHVRASRVPGSMWGDTFLNAVRGIQHAFNLCCSQVSMSNALMGAPVWLTNPTHQIKQVSMTSTPGGIVEATWGLDNPPPQRLDGRSIASSVMAYLQFLFAMMQDVSGQHEGGMMGGNAPGAESGVHIEAIQERDLAKLGATAQEIARAIEWWAMITLSNWAQYKSDPEEIALPAVSAGSDTVMFCGEDVYDSFQIIVAPETVMPQSRAARFNKNFLLWQNQIISKRDLLHRIGDEANEEASLDELHAASARAENKMALTGALSMAMLDPSYMDEMKLHLVEIHYEEHMRALLDPTTPSEAKLLLMQHLQVHDQIAMMAMMQMSPAPAEGTEEGPVDPNQPTEPAAV